MKKKKKTHPEESDMGQKYDALLSKRYLHDQEVERIVYINQILFFETACECVEFHGVSDCRNAIQHEGLDWLYHDIKKIDDKRLKVKIELTEDVILEFVCNDIRIFDRTYKNYYHI